MSPKLLTKGGEERAARQAPVALFWGLQRGALAGSGCGTSGCRASPLLSLPDTPHSQNVLWGQEHTHDVAGSRTEAPWRPLTTACLLRPQGKDRAPVYRGECPCRLVTVPATGGAQGPRTVLQTPLAGGQWVPALRMAGRVPEALCQNRPGDVKGNRLASCSTGSQGKRQGRAGAGHLPAGGCYQWPGCTCRRVSACFRN